MKGRGRGEGGVGNDASFMAVVKLSHRLFWQENICESGRYILVEVSFFYNHLLVFIKRALWVEEGGSICALLSTSCFINSTYRSIFIPGIICLLVEQV